VSVVFAGLCTGRRPARFKVAYGSLPLTHSAQFRSAARPALPDYVNHPIPTRRDHQMLNGVILIGRLTSDPTLEDRSGTQVGRLRLAVQRPRRDGEDRGADFVDITVFGNQAQVCNQYLAKGRRVAIEGRLQHSEWQAEDGSRRQKLEVIANSVEFLDRKPSDDQAPEAVEAAA
jgi:single-strand DNA-binding protein